MNKELKFYEAFVGGGGGVDVNKKLKFFFL